ncbi:MAG: 23S rRNA methyltransferase [Lachnospiraceae bacterium]|nr:23S rRNA methyltransferase [Lachnospiraceae bacterium]
MLEGKGASTTYEEIKTYVFEQTGLKVSSLYIGQVKDKCGIKERANYHLGSGKGSVPICPRDKEDAIKDAFKSFGMI